MKGFLKGFFVTLSIVGVVFLIGVFFLNRDNSSDAKKWVKDFTENSDKYQVLLIGVDALNVKKGENTRSDVMMILDVDNTSNSIRLVSIPRDSRAKVPGHGLTKINHAYAYGGADLSLQTVNETLGLDIPYYIVVDYAFVKEVVDTLGGIELDVPMDMSYEDPSADPPLYIDLKKGYQVLDGDKSLQFLRFRKGYKNADLDRVKAQQAFMSAFIQKLKSKESFIHAPRLFVSYLDYTQSNMPIAKVSRMGLNTVKIGQDNLTTFTLPGHPSTIDGLSYFIIDDDNIDRFLIDLGIKMP